MSLIGMSFETLTRLDKYGEGHWLLVTTCPDDAETPCPQPVSFGLAAFDGCSNKDLAARIRELADAVEAGTDMGKGAEVRWAE